MTDLAGPGSSPEPPRPPAESPADAVASVAVSELEVMPPDGAGPVAPREAPTPSLQPRHALEAFVVGLILMFAGGILAAPLEPVMGIAATIVGTQLGILGTVVFVLLRLRLPPAAAAPFRAPGIRGVLGGALLGLGAMFFSGTTIARLYDFGDDSYARELMAHFERLTAQLGVPATVALVGLMVPFCEELLFRGVILRALLGRWHPAFAIVGSAMLFAVYHLHPVHALVALVLGLAAGWAVVATGSFWAGFLVHAVNNSVVTLGSASAPAGVESAQPLAPAWGLFGAAILALGAFVVGRPAAASESPAAALDDSEEPPRSVP